MITDVDGDGVDDAVDNCPGLANSSQSDGDGDSHGNECDNCPNLSNPNQADFDLDGIGDACSCCSFHYGPGCSSDASPPLCEQLVCEIDPICCDLWWDRHCVSIAETFHECNECCGEPDCPPPLP